MQTLQRLGSAASDRSLPGFRHVAEEVHFASLLSVMNVEDVKKLTVEVGRSTVPCSGCKAAEQKGCFAKLHFQLCLHKEFCFQAEAEKRIEVKGLRHDWKEGRACREAGSTPAISA